MGSPVKFAHPIQPDCSHATCQGGQTCEAWLDRWVFAVVAMACPLAIEGRAHGIPFYFRARSGKWRLELRNEIVSQGDTDDFTVPSAIELIMKTIDAWIWEKA